MRLACRTFAVSLGLAVAGPRLVLSQHGPEPAQLRVADLAVGTIRVDEDSGSVRLRLGPPTAIDSTVWRYPGLQVYLKNGKVAIIALTDSLYATARGLRVGDNLGRVRSLYRSCYANSLLYQVCWPTEDFDERAITIELRRGRVVRINVGRILEP